MLVESIIFWRDSSVLPKRDLIFVFLFFSLVSSDNYHKAFAIRDERRIRNGKDSTFELLDLSD